MIQDQQDMEELLYNSVYQRWGKLQLPSLIEVIIEARKSFDLNLQDANVVARSMFEHHQTDLETMGYVFHPNNLSVPIPPRYSG